MTVYGAANTQQEGDQTEEKNVEEAPYTAARRSAFPSVPIKLFRRPPACRLMSGGGVEGEGETGGCGDMCSLAPKQDTETFKKVPVGV